MMSLIYAVLLFIALHLVVSGTALRGALVSLIGEKIYLAAFSIATLFAVVWMSTSYGAAPVQDLWAFPDVADPALSALVLIAAILVVAGVTTKNPTRMGMAEKAGEDDVATGFLRITRHPMMCGISLWAAVHLIRNGDLASVLFFGGFLAVAAVGPVLIDGKLKQRDAEAWDAFSAKTSYVPFAAIFQGRNSFKFGELGWGRIIGGIAVWAAAFYFHGTLSSVSFT